MTDVRFENITLHDAYCQCTHAMPKAVKWLLLHAFANVGDDATARNQHQIEILASWAYSFAKNELNFQRENAFTCTLPDDSAHVMVISPAPNRDEYIEGMRKLGWTVVPATTDDFSVGYYPSAEMLYKSLTGLFKNDEEAHRELDQHIDAAVRPFKFSELFFCLALAEIDHCVGACRDGEWTNDAINFFAEASAACVIGRGKLNWGVMYENSAELSAIHAADKRWSRLDPVKQLAFKRRKQFAHLKRSPAIDKFLPEILEACRAAGEPLSGGDPKATVERWFRKAGIK